MIQFNLLPNVKQEYVKARHTKQLVIVISLAVSAAALAVFILLILTVDVVQKKSLHDVNSDIAKYSKQLKSVPNLDKILTVQNQLNTLTGLHDKKVVTSRLFAYVSQVTPVQASISKLTVDYTANTIIVSGEAPGLDIVNTFADTLKQTNFKTDSTDKKAFTNVVLTSFGRDSKAATYTLSLAFDPLIFDSANNVTLSVPSGATGAQQQLFQKQAGS